MNKLNVKYLQNLRDTLSIQLMDSVQFIVGINTKKLNFAYTSDFAADASFRTSTLSMHGQTESKDIQAIGSGGRYIIGFLLKENQQKRLSEQTRDQVIEILKRGFKDTCGRDLASFCREGIATWTLQKGGHSYFEDIAVPT
jgi:20S proteasome alpha/beta subunit